MNKGVKQESFFFGVNYWASHAGIYTWRDWKPEIIEEDFKKLSSAGVKVLRVFPLWCDFQPITALYDYAGIFKEVSHGDEFLDASTEEGRAGVSLSMMEKFDYFVDLAAKYGFKIIVSLLNGWMSGRTFAPEALRGKNLILDPFCVKWEVRFVKYFVKRFRDKQNIIAWEQGNECNCLSLVNNQDEAYVWSTTINDAIRSQDASRPIISGMHSLAAGEHWKIKDQAEICDVLTIHPYILFTENCMLDKMVSPRAILHSPAEQTLYEDMGKRQCLVEEIGTLGPHMGSSERAAEFVRANLFNSWAHGSSGMLWWTAFDQMNLPYAPYEWAPVERELGIFRADGSEKLMVNELRAFDKFLKEIPYKNLPERNRDAVCLLSPDDWNGAYGAFMLAKRAGIELRFADSSECAPKSKLYIIPGGAAGVTRKSVFADLLKKVENGASLLITYGRENIVPFDEIIGCKSNGRYKAGEVSFEIDGKKLNITRDFAIDLEPCSAEVVLSDAEGKPLLTKNSYGKGYIMFFNAPIESYFAKTPAVVESELGYEKIYGYAARTAGIEQIVEKHNHNLALTVHKTEENSWVVVAINNTDKEIQDTLSFVNLHLAKAYRGKIDKEGRISIPAADAVVFELK